MRYPTCEKYGRIRFCKISRIKQKFICVKITPHMINRHDDNNDSPKQVDGFNAGGFGCGLWVDGCEFWVVGCGMWVVGYMKTYFK